MKSIVIELQQDALDRNCPVTDLLRKAFVVARKLKIEEFEVWVSHELEGYKEYSEIPEYREISGEVKAWNPYHGWLPVNFEDTEMANTVSKRNSGQGVAEIESLLDGRKDNSEGFKMPFSPDHQRIISKSINFETQVTLMTPHTGLVRILDSVRNIVLNWALKLEEDGVLGEGMTFSESEKAEVGKHSYNINNFYAPVTGAQIQQETSASRQDQEIEGVSIAGLTKFLETLRNDIKNLKIESELNDELMAELATLEAQVTSPKPKDGIIRESLGSIRRILEGAGGGVVGQLLAQLGSFF